MLARIFHKALNYIKQVQEMALFATMADARWFVAFGVSPLFLIMLPFIGVLSTANALFNVHYFRQASNKNLNEWMNVIVSATCAILASISLYGAPLSVFWGVSFTAGPWFFFSSLMVAMTHQLSLLSLNAYRAYESLSGSAQRMHYIQAAFSNLFVMGLLSSALGSLLFVMLFPTVAPAVGIASAISAASFILVDLWWRMFPHNWKLAIKGALNLGKPELPKNEVVTNAQDLRPNLDKNPNHHRLFTRFDYSIEVRKMDVDTARAYLQDLILRKINNYGTDHSNHDDKTQNKVFVLEKLLEALSTDSEQVIKSDLLKDHPLAFQSFFVEIGDVELICDAVIIFKEKAQALIVNPDMSILTHSMS